MNPSLVILQFLKKKTQGSHFEPQYYDHLERGYLEKHPFEKLNFLGCNRLYCTDLRVHNKATTHSYAPEESSSATYSSLYQPLQIKQMKQTTSHDTVTSVWNHTEEYKNQIFVDNHSEFEASYSSCADAKHYLVSKNK